MACDSSTVSFRSLRIMPNFISASVSWRNARLAVPAIRFVAFSFYLFYPITFLYVRLARVGLKVTGQEEESHTVTEDDIRVRMAAVDQDIWPLPATREMVVDQSQQQTLDSHETVAGLLGDLLGLVQNPDDLAFVTGLGVPPERVRVIGQDPTNTVTLTDAVNPPNDIFNRTINTVEPALRDLVG